MAAENDRLGGKKDSISIEIDRKIVKIAEQYQVKTSVLQQPGAMTVRIGSAQTARELLAMIKPRKSRYRLFLNDVLLQSGIIYGRGVPGGTSTIVEVKGRDYQSVLRDAYVREEKAFHEKTYKEFVRRVLDEIGLTEAKGHRLVTSNDVNRLKLTGRNVKATTHTVDGPSQPKSLTAKEEQEAKARAYLRQNTGLKLATFELDKTPDLQRAGFNPANQRLIAGRLGLQHAVSTPSSLVEERRIDGAKTSAASGSSSVVVQTLKVELGTQWISAVERELKLVGLFVWCAADGSFILARPNANQSPSFRLFRQRGGDRLITNIIDCHFDDDTTDRHTSAIAYGRSGKGKAGRNKYRGEFVDDQLTDSEFDAPLVLHDNEVQDDAQAAYMARKAIAEERRAGWKLTYTVSGHTTNLISSADGSSTNWTTDTVVEVDDRELGIQGNFYLEGLTFNRDPKTTTEIVLMRPDDLVFAEDLYPKPIVVQKAPTKKLDAGVETPVTAEEPDAEPAAPEAAE